MEDNLMILVTGADGLLGSWICARHSRETIGFTHKELDITDTDKLYDVILEVEPDAVINCAGITKHQTYTTDEMISVNALAPHRIAKMCDLIGAKLVSVSSDCVFSGKQGDYLEYGKADATDVYGQTKYRGEVEYNPHLSIRTSFVGWPDPKGRGLLAWLFSQKKVQGWKNVYWNGLCVPTLADALVELAYGRQHGMMHLFGDIVSKYDLLVLAAHVYDYEVEIEPAELPILNRTLSSVRKDRYEIKSSLLEQLVEMREWRKSYTEYQLSCQ